MQTRCSMLIISREFLRNKGDIPRVEMPRSHCTDTFCPKFGRACSIKKTFKLGYLECNLANSKRDLAFGGGIMNVNRGGLDESVREEGWKDLYLDINSRSFNCIELGKATPHLN